MAKALSSLSVEWAEKISNPPTKQASNHKLCLFLYGGSHGVVGPTTNTQVEVVAWYDRANYSEINIYWQESLCWPENS